jgi:hypothetical protein
MNTCEESGRGIFKVLAITMASRFSSKSLRIPGERDFQTFADRIGFESRWTRSIKYSALSSICLVLSNVRRMPRFFEER